MTSPIIIAQGQAGVLTWAYGLATAGYNQETAFQIPALRNFFSAVVLGQYGILPAVGVPTEIVVVNETSTILSILPPKAWRFVYGGDRGVNNPVTIQAYSPATFMSGDPNGVATYYIR